MLDNGPLGFALQFGTYVGHTTPGIGKTGASGFYLIPTVLYTRCVVCDKTYYWTGTFGTAKTQERKECLETWRPSRLCGKSPMTPFLPSERIS